MTGAEHEFTFSVPAPPDRVFTAWTDPDELGRWFSDHAEVEPREGGAFRFWGPHTYGAPTGDDARQRVLQWDPPHHLAFTWELHGQPSEVRIGLGDDPETPGATLVRGRHTFATAPEVGRVADLLEDLWKIHQGNLKTHLEGGTVFRVDFTDRRPEVRATVVVDVPRSRLFRAFLDPAFLQRWIAGTATVEPRIGGRYEYGWRYEVGGREVAGGPTRILELVENERLVTDWPDWRGDASVPPQTITWLFEDEGRGTRVTVVHAGFARPVDISDYPFGWGYFLGALAAACAPQGTA